MVRKSLNELVELPVVELPSHGAPADVPYGYVCKAFQSFMTAVYFNPGTREVMSYRFDEDVEDYEWVVEDQYVAE